MSHLSLWSDVTAEADAAALQAERRYGVLRLLRSVDGALAAKFERQKAHLDRAIESGDIEASRIQAAAMVRAYAAITAAAEKAKVEPLSVSARAAAEVVRQRWPGASVSAERVKRWGQ